MWEPSLPHNVLHCSSHQECHNDIHCTKLDWDLSSTCLGLHDPETDCKNGECGCVRGHYHPNCTNQQNYFDLQDGGWCFDGRRDEYCVDQSTSNYLQTG